MLDIDHFIAYFSKENVKKWWIWGYWTSPMMYGMNAIAVNEFLGDKWNIVSIKFIEFPLCDLIK